MYMINIQEYKSSEALGTWSQEHKSHKILGWYYYPITILQKSSTNHTKYIYLKGKTLIGIIHKNALEYHYPLV